MTRVVLDTWLEESGFLNMKGFTPAQRDRLVGLGGQEVLAKTFSPARRVSNLYAGFYTGGDDWVFKLTAAGGNLDRSKVFTSYAALQEVLLELDDVDNLAIRTVTAAELYVLAAYGSRSRISQRGKPWYTRRVTSLNNGYVYTDGACSRYVSVKEQFKVDNIPRELVRINPSITYPDVPARYAEIIAKKPLTVFLPVIK